MMRRCRGFTKWDLLVSIGIVLLLAAILLPSLAEARRRARRVTCMGNLGEIQKALQKYTTQWNALLPFGLEAPAVERNFWTGPLEAYLKDAQKTRQCPQARQRNEKIFTAGSAQMPWNQPDKARGA